MFLGEEQKEERKKKTIELFKIETILGLIIWKRLTFWFMSSAHWFNIRKKVQCQGRYDKITIQVSLFGACRQKPNVHWDSMFVNTNEKWVTISL